MLNPTQDTYKTLNAAYDFFNTHLFDGKLPTCLITMQRKGKARGFFCAERFETRKSEEDDTDTFYIHEIALNPSGFKDRTDQEIISTLVHEMAHLWQQEFGKPPSGNYHDSEWADKMEEIGLIPSNTGDVDGKRTGHAMTHYIDEKGRYADLISVFMEENPPISFQDRSFASAAKAKAKNKIKYRCPECGVNAWGKPSLSLKCGEDDAEFVKA
jgi:predicted SprT family Zn-dependent metalloprotease